LLQDKTGAASDYNRAVELDPMDLELGLENARTLEWAGRLEEAKKQYKRVLEIDKKLPRDEPKRLSEEDRGQAKEKAGI
jgi:predicted TPR repeat methyltransferase